MQKILFISLLSFYSINMTANQPVYENPSFIGLTAIAAACGIGAGISLWEHQRLSQEHAEIIKDFSPEALSLLEKKRKEVHNSQLKFSHYNKAAILNNRVNYEHVHQATTSKAKRKRYCQKMKQLCGDCQWTDQPLIAYTRHDAFAHTTCDCENEDNWRPQKNQRAQQCGIIARAHFDMQHSIANEITDSRKKRKYFNDDLSHYSCVRARLSLAKDLEEQAYSARIASYAFGLSSLASLISLGLLKLQA